MRVGIFIGGCVSLFIAFIVLFYPIGTGGESVAGTLDYCTSSLGSLAKSFSGDIQETCKIISITAFASGGIGLLGIILIILGVVLKQKSSEESKPISKSTIKALVISIIVIVGLGMVGVVYYYSLQPDMQVTNINIVPTENEEMVLVVDRGRVSSQGDFQYYSKNGGTYHLVFSNDFSIFSRKYVAVQYTDKGNSYYEEFSIPAGSHKTITVYAYPGQTLRGSFGTSGGSGDDVDFFIYKQECKLNVRFSFNLANYGPVDGNALVKFRSDGNAIWSDTLFVESEKQISKNNSVTIRDCNYHDFDVIVAGQQRVD